MGPKMYLTNQEEKELVDFLLNCAKTRYAEVYQDKTRCFKDST